MSNYSDRKSDRVDRLNARADAHRKESARRLGAASALADNIPFGQPILVGHHSEGRARRDADRIDTNMRKGIAAQKKAEELERRAQAAESNTSISSDDPNALVALKIKLARLENLRARMVQTNRQYRKGGADSITGISDEQRDTIRGAGGPPFEKYELTNLGARVRATKKRIAHLESQAGDVTSEEMHGEVTLRDDVESNRLMLLFPGKPLPTVITALKQHGFHWSPSNEAWQRHRGNSAKHAASCVLDTIINKGENS